jgi:hypothetical protein
MFICDPPCTQGIAVRAHKVEQASRVETRRPNRDAEAGPPLRRRRTRSQLPSPAAARAEEPGEAAWAAVCGSGAALPGSGHRRAYPRARAQVRRAEAGPSSPATARAEVGLSSPAAAQPSASARRLGGVRRNRSRRVGLRIWRCAPREQPPAGGFAGSSRAAEEHAHGGEEEERRGSLTHELKEGADVRDPATPRGPPPTRVSWSPAASIGA